MKTKTISFEVARIFPNPIEFRQNSIKLIPERDENPLLVMIDVPEEYFVNAKNAVLSPKGLAWIMEKFGDVFNETMHEYEDSQHDEW